MALEKMKNGKPWKTSTKIRDSQRYSEIKFGKPPSILAHQQRLPSPKATPQNILTPASWSATLTSVPRRSTYNQPQASAVKLGKNSGISMIRMHPPNKKH